MNNLPDKKNDSLGRLINPSLLEEPSSQFTFDVMNKLGINTAVAPIKYEPVISKKMWMLIAACTGIIFYLALSGSTEGSFNHQIMLVQSTIDRSSLLITKLFSGSFAALLTMAAAAIFVIAGVDSWYRNYRLKLA